MPILLAPLETMVARPDRIYIAAALLLVAVAIIRVTATYSSTAQTFDEPCHVAAGIELLDKGRYTLDPTHPTLARIAIALPLYAAGRRLPNLSPPDSLNYNIVGNAILHARGQYLHSLVLARLGVLPFFLLGCAVVFFWSRQEYGNFAGLLSLAFFTTIPSVLAFSSIAYTDMVAASTQLLALWVFTRWLRNEDLATTPVGALRSALWLGLAGGLALLGKLTSPIFLPAAGLGLLLLKRIVSRQKKIQRPLFSKAMARHFAVAAAIAIVVLWAGYGFAVGHVDESMNLSPAAMPPLRSFPSPVANFARYLIRSDPKVPAPALIKALAIAWTLNHLQPPGYLLGHIKPGGWWYFFLVGIAVKLPIPILLLVGAGLVPLKHFFADGRWMAIAPAACALAIFLVTMPVKVNYGVRHVLVVFPLLAIVAGCGCTYLWNLSDRRRALGRIGLILVLVWQCVSTVRAGGDFIAYFNEFAGKNPSNVLVAGCDLDCGQDLFALSRELKSREIKHFNLAIWTSADLTQTDLPPFNVAQPSHPVKGWFAISLRALRMGELLHVAYPLDAFAWLNRYQPVAHVGKTILLYDIPETAPPGSGSP